MNVELVNLSTGTCASQKREEEDCASAVLPYSQPPSQLALGGIIDGVTCAISSLISYLAAVLGVKGSIHPFPAPNAIQGPTDHANRQLTGVDWSSHQLHGEGGSHAPTENHAFPL